jgi:hypothetical protein
MRGFFIFILKGVCMKKLILILNLLVLLPTLTSSQVSSWRTNPPTSSSSSSSSNTRTTQTDNSTSSWRQSTPNEYNKPNPSRPGLVRNQWNPSPWGWNRWNMWGAPSFGWNSWSPMWYWNDWGYRQPARVYYYNDGRRDTVRGKRPIINFGLHHTTNRQMGAFFVIGNKGYFITEFNSTYERDRSTYFPYGTIDRVDFPLTSDLIKLRAFYVGAGKRMGRIGVHGMIGFANERILWRGNDRVGQITFPKSKQNFTTLKIGVLRDLKNFTLKVDYDPIMNYGQFGLGLNL